MLILNRFEPYVALFFLLNKEFMNYRQKIGAYGERLVVDYLIRHNFLILAKNYRIKHLEIDIIAKIKEITVFVEVKTRTTGLLGSAEDAIDENKTNKIIKAINLYLMHKNLDPNKIRFDFIAVDINKRKKTAKIKHFKEII